MIRLFSKDTAAVDGTGAAIAVGLIALTAVAGVAPVRHIKHLHASRETEMLGIQAETRAALSDLQRLERMTKEAENAAQDLQLTLLPISQLNTRLARVIARAESYGLTVGSMTPGEPTSGELHRRTPIELSVEGELPAFVRFLHGLRTEDTDLTVMGLSIHPTPQNGITAEISADWLTRAD